MLTIAAVAATTTSLYALVHIGTMVFLLCAVAKTRRIDTAAAICYWRLSRRQKLACALAVCVLMHRLHPIKPIPGDAGTRLGKDGESPETHRSEDDSVEEEAGVQVLQETLFQR